MRKVPFTIPEIDPIQGILSGSGVCNELIRVEDVTWNRPHFFHAFFDHLPVFRLPICSTIALHPGAHRLHIHLVGYFTLVRPAFTCVSHSSQLPTFGGDTTIMPHPVLDTKYSSGGVPFSVTQ
ncbi:hypothetical protein TcCL_Unassigned02881 [Trypanosoma cruzi]|nr:hypothetical protein TcCL_Unassigned02881 [Trypanosoma cruzi]